MIIIMIEQFYLTHKWIRVDLGVMVMKNNSIFSLSDAV